MSRKQAILLLLVIAATVSPGAAIIDTIDIFHEGRLRAGATLVHGSLVEGKIITSPLGADGWGAPRFELHGLDIDLTGIANLAQVKLRIIRAGGDVPNYTDILLYNSHAVNWWVENFPFKAYDRNDPLYITKGLQNTNTYGDHPQGEHYGALTGLGINVGHRVVLHITTIQTEVEGDVYFPQIPENDFSVVDEKRYLSNIDYLYERYERVRD